MLAALEMAAFLFSRNRQWLTTYSSSLSPSISEDMEFLVVDILEEGVVEGVLNSVADDSGLVHALYEALGCHALAEAWDDGLVLIVLQLLGDIFDVVVLFDVDFDTEV